MARLFTPSESKYYLMALDAGTGSIRAVIFDLEGNQIAVGQAEWRHLAVPDVPGSMEFDLNKNWQLACECMRQALHNAGIAPEYIAAVSACSMREGIVLYNNEGTPIWACANVDARAAREVSELKELHNNTFENEVYRATGQTLALSAIPRLLWLAHHRSDIYRQASTITMISDWLAYMLSGELAVDPSNAGTTGLLDLTTRDWKPALLDMAGLRADILSPVKETGTLLGVVSSQAAELCGLKAGTPVVVGGGDVQLGCLGLGVVRPAQTAVLGGTFWQQVVNLAAPVTDPEMNVRVNPHVIPGMVQAESISFFTGLTMRWFRDAFCAEEKLIAERLGIDTYTLLEEMASRVPPGSWGVMPIFSDRMRFKTWYHAAPSFINLSIDPDKCNKATLFRALEENAAIVSACNLQQIADFSNIHPSSLVFAGGGSKGKLWSQILADVSGLPVNIPVVKEATALGCAIAAGVGAGIFSSMAETGERLVRWERTHTPDPEKHELNEYYCLLLAKELGLNVPDAEIIKAGRVRALAVERFDRRWNTERTVLLRLPQEDMCQTFGLPSSVKYESDGGPGIARIMAFLMGSSEALRDRYDFMKFQVFQWLIGATDGHAKNFSVFIQAGGSYRLTPFYDIISAFPVLGGTGIHISDLKLAMGLNASKGKKTAIDKIYPRHFLATAKVLRFPEVQMHEILSDFARMIPAALDNVKTSLPTDFPENVVTAVETNVLRLHGRLSREYGSK